MKRFLPFRIQSLLIVALCCVAFIFGAASQYYKLSPSGFMQNAIDAGEAWKASLKDEHQTLVASSKSKRQQKKQAILFAVKKWNKTKAFNGYTLISHRGSTKVHLINMAGRIIHKWDIPFHHVWSDPPHINRIGRELPFIETAHLFPNGDLIVQYTGIGDTPYGYGLAKVTRNGEVLWSYAQNAHHDFYVDKDNFVYALTQEIIYTPIQGLETLEYPMLVDYIVKLSPEGKELERISIMEAILHSEFALTLFKKQKNYKSRKWDYLHTNTVRKLESSMANNFPQFKAGQLLVSIRNLGAVAVIDPKNRKVIWLYTGPWIWQHDANFLENGNILLMDNRGHHAKNSGRLRVIEFNPHTLETTWQYTDSPNDKLKSLIYGRTQRLPNGNTLAVVAAQRRILEITPNGKIAWDFKVTHPPKRSGIRYLCNAKRYAEDELPFLLQPMK